MNPSSRAPMASNAAFSLLTGGLIAAAPSTVGGWLGVEIDGWLRLLGVVLIAHGLLLLWAVGRPDPVPWAKLNLLAIAPYPVLMIVLVGTGLISRSLGQTLALLDGAIVGSIAVWHWLSLREPVSVGHAQHA